MGEEKKEEEKKDEVKDEGKKKEEQKEKKVEEPPEIVLKVDMHCEACARKVARALKGFQGVEEVTTDSKARKVVVKGKAADPLKIYERLKKKTRRKVVLISPLPEPPEQNNQDPSPPPKEEKMVEPPPVVTVVLSIRMHCEACAQALQKRVLKIRGVESVETNVATSQVIVKGIVDPTELISDVYKKTGKQAFIVKGEEKKKEEEKKEEVNKEEEKKEEEKKEEKKDDDEEEKAYTNRNEYWPSKSYLEYACCAPEMFSEDNPNACYVM